MFAGRNISATHMAMSSTRVMATCALMGQAVGTAAAIAVKTSLTPRGIYEKKIGELQDLLIEQDCYLPGHARKIPALTKKASVSVSNGSPDNLLNGIERPLAGKDNGWWGGENDTITLTWQNEVKAKRVRIVFDSDFSLFKRLRCNYPDKYPPVKMPAMLARDFDVDICCKGKWKTVCSNKNNRRRLVMLDLPQEPMTGCRLRLKSAWGGGKMHIYSFEAI